MRMPKGRFATGPGPKSPLGEECLEHGVNPDGFYDPEGTRFGLPTYPYRLAPKGFATRRQLRKQNMCPGGKPIRAQIIWKHKGIGKNGRGATTRRVAYLYAVDDAKPKRVPTPAQLEAVQKALAARRTCQSCGVEQDYYIPRSRGECNRCAEPELYADPAPDSSFADSGWDSDGEVTSEWDCQPAENDWDPDDFAADAELSALSVDLEAS
jgi:hypothetical protein